MIHHELFFGIKHYKWLIYELPLNENSTDKSIMYWHHILSYFKKLDEFIENDYEYEENVESFVKVLTK